MSEKTGSLMDGVIETIKTIVYALLIAGVFRTVFFQPFWIPSGSMKDTLLIGDFLFVNKMAYGYSKYSCPFGICPIEGRIFGGEPVRGDVVVFRHPVNGQDFIKRVVGLPGDKVQMRSGQLFLNGSPVPQIADGTFIETYERQGPVGSYPLCREGRPSEGGDCSKEKSDRDPSKRRPALGFERGQWPLRQHRCLYRPRGTLFLRRRQPGQFHRQSGQARVQRRRLRALRSPDRTRRPGHVFIGRAVFVLCLDMASRPVFQADRLMRPGAELEAFARRLGHNFRNAELLVRAVTHASMSSATRADNQRLEFLGDRVLGVVIAEALLAADKGASEGQLAPRYNALVRKETCADVARQIDLGAVLKLGRSEMKSGGRRKEALLGDAMEAVIAAVYVDAGFDAARKIVLALWGDRIATVEADARDAKTSLQEWAQARGQVPPTYEETGRRGPDHAPVFTVEVQLASGEKAAFSAPSKRAAEQGAARALLERLT